MVQRYDFAEDEGHMCTCCTVFSEEGPYVRYEDYLALHALMCRLTDQINLCELPEGLYNELEFAGLL